MRPRACRWSSGRTESSKNAPNPNAARLFQCYCFTPECQQLVVDTSAACARCICSPRRSPGANRLGEVKTFKEDPGAVEKMGEEIKARYSKLFGV
jgi:iron(III) transport system substrate-binding protein